MRGILQSLLLDSQIKVKLILLYQLKNYDKTLINNTSSCKRMFFETLVLRKLLDIRYTLSYVKHALINLYVYHAFNVRLICVLKMHVLHMFHFLLCS